MIRDPRETVRVPMRDATATVSCRTRNKVGSRTSAYRFRRAPAPAATPWWRLQCKYGVHTVGVDLEVRQVFADLAGGEGPDGGAALLRLHHLVEPLHQFHHILRHVLQKGKRPDFLSGQSHFDASCRKRHRDYTVTH
eukprot:5954637-Pyramimonas_sp.AAC.1